MSKRHYRYVGRCDDCERTVERDIGFRASTSKPDPVKWGRCRECERIVAIRKESPETAMTDWETSV